MTGPHTIGPALTWWTGAGTGTMPALGDRSRQAAALLQPEDLGGAETVAAPRQLCPYLRPPRPGPDRYRSEAMRADSRAISAVYTMAEWPTLLLEHLGFYREGGAAAYLAELRAALSGLHGRAEGTRHWAVVDEDVAGDESLVLRLRECSPRSTRAPASRRTRYLVVARVGGGVIVLGDLGWRLGDGHEALVRRLAPVAVNRAERLRTA
ncbi:MAG TPA: hypothetical protein VFT95_00055 [Micromonosporaceae bacterium]|nr:hypothetical protein [Micromonosporaceae bacterium]